MAAVGVAVMFVGFYLCYVAYEAIHNGSGTAAPVTKATTALSPS
jgi:hypothetical protein